MSSPRPRILLVEDEPQTAAVLSRSLTGAGFEVVIAATGEAALQEISSGKFEVAAIDWGLPGLSGLDLVKDLRARLHIDHSRLPILMITGRDHSIDTILALEMGANDVVQKPVDQAVLVARLRALLRRRELTQPTAAARRLVIQGFEVDLDSHQAWADGELLPLSRSEFAVLKALLSNHGRVMSRQTLIDLALGRGAAVTSRAIDTHIFTLRGKLGRYGDLIQTVRGAGYRIDVE